MKRNLSNNNASIGRLSINGDELKQPKTSDNVDSQEVVKLSEKSHSSSSSQDEPHEPAIELVTKICFIVIWPLDKILPVKTYPELALLIIFVVIYVMCEFILTIMNVFSVYTGLPHFLVGLTLMVWGSDNLEMLNMAISVKNNEE